MTNDLQGQLAAIDRDIESAKKVIEKAEALTRLSTNRDFKTLISEGLFKDEALRLVFLKADSNMQSPDKQAAILRDLDTISGLNSYFQTVCALANQAKGSLESSEAMREEIEQEMSNG